MKKLAIVLTLFLLSLNCSYASFEQYYDFDSNLDVKFIPTKTKLEKEAKKEYQKILKNEKYMQQGRYEKANNYMPNYIPNLARFINIHITAKNFPAALASAQKLLEIDKTNLFPKSAKEYRLGILYSQNGDYINSNKYLYPYINTDTWAKYQIAQNYYYMQDFTNSEKFANTITQYDGSFMPAQELLYSIYTITKNPQKAYKVAKNLIYLDSGNPQNYLNLANVTTNNTEKLNNYYKAKELFEVQNLTDMVAKVNEHIAPLEQLKIDLAHKKLSTYCKKPDWSKIKQRNKKYLDFDKQYWTRRQADFFEEANECINRFYGNNLAACFNDLNSSQERMDLALIEEYAKKVEAEQREIQIRQMVQQNRLLEEQNRIQRYRYYYNYGYYPRYYRSPYWW